MRIFPALVPLAALLAQAPAPKPAVPAAKPATKAAAKPAAPRPAGAKPAITAKPAGTKPTAAAKPAIGLQTDEQKAIYALGLSIHRSLSQFELSAPELELLKRAISDAAAGKPAGELNEWGPKIEPLAKSRQAKVAERVKAESKVYLDQAAAKPGAEKADSGLVFRSITPGTGDSPKATDRVKVHYRGTLVNGTEFDSSYKRNEPAEFPLSGVIPCWTEGVQKIKVGGKAQLVCPSQIAYGDGGRPPVIPGGATLVFEVELIGITTPPPPAPEAPKAPEQPKQPEGVK